MTFEELQAAVMDLHAEAKEKIDHHSVHVQFLINDYSRPQIGLYGPALVVGKHGVEYFTHDDPSEAIRMARQHIAELPTKEKRATTVFQRRMADAINDAFDEGVDAEILEGARLSLKAASEALLPAPARAIE